MELDPQAFASSAGAGLLNEVGRNVDAADDAAIARGDDCKVSGATSHIKDVRAGTQGLTRHEFAGNIFDRAGDLSEITGFPGSLLFGFDHFKIRYSRGSNNCIHIRVRLSILLFIFGFNRSRGEDTHSCAPASPV